MRHLNYKDRNSIAFIDSIISALRRGKNEKEPDTRKMRCQMIRVDKEDTLKAFDTAHDDDNYDDILQNYPILSTQAKEDFLSLYDFNKKQIQDLHDAVLTEDGYENPFCPLCEVNIAGTMDHYLPKSQYQLFAVHPKNLIPCCSICNGHKSSGQITKDGKRVFWNAYLDNPPIQNYIVCYVYLDGSGLPKAKFMLQQNGIEDDLYNRIEATIKDAHILETYEKAANKKIIEITKKVKSRFSSNIGTIEESLSTVLNLAVEAIDGTDFWQMSLYNALGNTAAYLEFLKNEI